ncbi:hypothetical protein JCM6882_008003 [Rhodosporidiobolus microsporus]
MRFTTAFAALAAAATTVSAGWLPPLLSPAGGETFKNGDTITITWDTSNYNSSANDFGKFFLGYKNEQGGTTVGQFVGRAASFGDEYKLWEGEDSVSFTVDIPTSVAALGQPIWTIVEFPTTDSQESGLFTVTA